MKILCPKCKGRGTVINLEAAICTLGLSALLQLYDGDRKTCPNCKGKGKI